MKNVKKIMALFFLFAVIHGFDAPSALANQMLQIPKIVGRGVLNVASSPLEVLRTPIVESGQHRYLWPLTGLPRIFRNVAYRLTSGLYDIGFYPLATPFLDEAPPFTEKMGISNYIWNNEDDY